MGSNYSRLKDNILNELMAVESYARQREVIHLAAYIKETVERLNQDKFNLVVLGEFKRGKTTFLNALLGVELLPVAVVPLTSIVTVVRYGEDLRTEVVFLNGYKKEIDLTELASYVTEEGNPGNAKKVKLVELAYPSPYLKEGVLLIDTPGVGSVYQNNTDETYKFLPKVDAAIFLLSADQPLSQSECAFLNEIKQYSTKTFFVLNKIDYLNQKDRQEALDYAKRTLKDKAGFENANIIPLSAKMGLEARLASDDQKLTESNLPVFIKILEQFLLSEKGTVVLISAGKRGISAADELLTGIRLETKALQLPLEELQIKIGLFNQMVENLNRDRQDNKYIFQGEMEKVYHALEKEITIFQESRRDFIEKEIDRLYQDKKGLRGGELLKFFETYIEAAVKEAFENWKPLVEEKVRAAFDKVVARFTEKTNKAIEELLKQSAEIFEIHIESFTKMEALTEESKLYFVFGDEQSMLLPDPVKISANFLPGFIAGPKILREMKKKAERELDRNCGRLRTDYNDRIYESARRFQKALEEKFISTVNGAREALARAVDKRQRSGRENEEAIYRLDMQKEQLEGIKLRLRSVIKKIKDECDIDP